MLKLVSHYEDSDSLNHKLISGLQRQLQQILFSHFMKKLKLFHENHMKYKSTECHIIGI